MRNAYELILDLRSNLTETSESFFKDASLLRKLNKFQRRVAGRLMEMPGDWMLKKSSALTPSSSVVTAPSDCVKPAYMEEVSSGRPINIEGTVRERRFDRPIGATIYDGAITAYLRGSEIVVNQESYSESVYLWYYYRPVDMHAGVLESGASSTALPFELANFPSPTDDYYNDLEIEVIGDLSEMSKGIHTITDYAGSTGIATVAAMSTAAEESDYYGTVLELPEESHDLIIAEVTLECVAQIGASVSPNIYNYWRGVVKDARQDFEDFFSTHKAGSKHVRTSEVW